MQDGRIVTVPPGEASAAGLPCITTFGWVPEFARGFVRDLRPRWALEETGQPYAVHLIRDAKAAEYRVFQPFGQVPAYRDEAVEIFESGAMVLRIAERGGSLLPTAAEPRMRAIQWLIAALNSVEPAVMALVINDFFEADRPWSAERKPVVTGHLETRLGELQARLGEKTWLEGDAFTVGDLMMVSVLGSLRNMDVLGGFPGLAAYVARGEDRPAYRQAMADHLAVFAEA